VIVGVFHLAFRHARHSAIRSLLIVACIALSIAIPLIIRVLSTSLSRHLNATAASTSLVIGAKGGRIDLVLATLYHRRAPSVRMTTGDWMRLRNSGIGGLIPLNAMFTAQGFPVVAIPPDYYALRGVRCASGELPVMVGEAALGWRVARRLGTGPGDHVFTDQAATYNIAAAPSIKLRVTGVLDATGTADDDAIFTDLKTAWVMAGLSHGHVDAARAVPEKLVLERTPTRVAVSEELLEYNEVTRENAGSLHLHASEDALPLTGLLCIGLPEKELHLFRARINAMDSLQAVEPADAIAEIMGHVAKFEQVFNAVSVAMIAMTSVLVAVVLALSNRMRAREFETLDRIGAARSFIAMLTIVEAVGMLLVGAAIAAAVAGGAWLWPPDLMKLV
jgi:putative ABC transport system permease protein